MYETLNVKRGILVGTVVDILHWELEYIYYTWDMLEFNIRQPMEYWYIYTLHRNIYMTDAARYSIQVEFSYNICTFLDGFLISQELSRRLGY